MKISEDRQNVAHILVVPYDATPEIVNQAYRRRLEQRMGVDDIDDRSFLRGNIDLYDAKSMMQYPPSRQWYGYLKTKYTPTCYKNMDLMLDMLDIIRNKNSDIVNDVLLRQIVSKTQKLKRKYNLFHATLGYELAGLGGIVYNCVNQNHNTIVPLVLYSSMLAAAVVMAYTKGSINKTFRDLSVWMNMVLDINSR